ncbi:MAG TPA: hypothetical protein VMW78_02015 [Anaerolineae bacterium]|nr:hypothetical protein [Anaerolineae bacterium]
MNIAEDDYIQSPSSGVMEDRWIKKKEALLKSLSKGGGVLKIDRENLTMEKKRVVSEVERLEEENHLMSRSVRDFQLQLSEKRRKSRILLKRSDVLKKKLVRLLARERDIINEIQFYEAEKAKLSDTHLEVSERLRAEISVLGSTVKGIDFMKGEMEVFINKMGMLEREVPVKATNVDNLDEKITGGIKALKDLYNRMQVVERKVKTNYYTNKR